ncbi:helicase, putative [Plasmodium ovale wallikeri]|uniref:Helicase, putative n=1 Tax=Plasmodium ovale wallikeri TaxID=864142 RepID=A0A1A8ZB22_PLAOA|nr:helicase, putative [Plasmodium ovale wallikeri]
MMLPVKEGKKKKSGNPFICNRRLGIYKKKIYQKSHQLIYVSLDGRVYTNVSESEKKHACVVRPHYREIVQVDNAVLNELKIAKTGKGSSISDIQSLYKRVNYMKTDIEFLHLNERKFEHYCVPPSIIRQYNAEGVYELYKEQAECLRIIFRNEDDAEKGADTQVRDSQMMTAQTTDLILNSDFFVHFQEFEGRDESKKRSESNMMSKNASGSASGSANANANANASAKQEEMLDVYSRKDNEREYQNCIFNIPTGMGKSIIYDILIIQLVLYKGYRTILTLPTISLINEKNDYYEKLLGDNTVSLNIKKYNSFNFTGYTYNHSIDIALCTYEQANTIINRIIKNRLNCNYLFIIDEIHYINDEQRGFFIESLLTKIKYLQNTCELPFSVRIYGFSATLPNIEQLGRWLDARVHVSVEKLQKIKCLYKMENGIYRDMHKLQIERTLENPHHLDPDHLAYLLSEELILKRNVLIFCPTKKKSEKVASFVSSIMPHYLNKLNYKVETELLEKRQALIKQLKYEDIKVANINKLILNGIFYHHSELGKYEKDIIENAFRNGILFCLCCTTTLSVGVNFNVHTVLIRSIRLGNTYLTKEHIIQIAGRCGRIKKVISSNSVYDTYLKKNDDNDNNKTTIYDCLSKENVTTENVTAENVTAENVTAENVTTENFTTENISNVKDYDQDCDGKVLTFLTHEEKNYLDKILNNTQFNKNLFPHIFVQFVKYLFLMNISNNQYNFYVYDVVKDDDVISSSEISPYTHSICTSLDFIFNYSLIQYVYVKGFPPDVLLMIFVFCLSSEISLKIYFEVYEEMLLSKHEGNNAREIFHFFDLSMEKLRKFRLKRNSHTHLRNADASVLKGEINIDQICETFEWVKIKRFYFSLIVYDLFTEDIYTVSRRYRLQTKELKNLYVKSCHNLSFHCKVLRNFKNSL